LFLERRCHLKNFGERLRKKRMDMRLTMREVAERLGVSETTVYNWEIRNIGSEGKNSERVKDLSRLRTCLPAGREDHVYARG